MASKQAEAGPSRPRQGGQLASAPEARSTKDEPLHFFPTPALDHAFAGVVAGSIATICMNPLDLIRVQFQVNTSNRAQQHDARPQSRIASLGKRISGIGAMRDMSDALKTIIHRDGASALYRGLTTNIVGNASSWALFFYFNEILKEKLSSDDDPSARKLSAGQQLLAASGSGAFTALLTNPIWVVKTRIFTTTKTGEPIFQAFAAQSSTQAPSAARSRQAASRSYATSVASVGADGVPEMTAKQGLKKAEAKLMPAQPRQTYNGLIDGLRQIWRHEGIKGLYVGSWLALAGVANGAVQFTTYEELKRWRMNVARRRMAQQQGRSTASVANDNAIIKLDNSTYTLISGASKLVAIGATYPIQLVRSRIQANLHPDVPTCVRLTWRHEGVRGFYKGTILSAFRTLPATCVTFVVYENCSWALRGLAERRSAREEQQPAETSSS